jgi:protein-S-isoprenylcysteine O-methyltransferase Ste14
MARLSSVVAAALALAFLGVVDVYMVYRDFRADGRLSITTTVLVWTLYLLHAGLTVYAAWYGMVALPLPTVAAIFGGTFVLVVGFVIVAAGVREFRSVSRMSGRDEDELVTTGVYRWSRNPQNVGWLLSLAGVGVIGRSGLALALVALFALLLHGYIVAVEEPHLTRVFGADYRGYRAWTPRYLGRPREPT